MSDNTSSSKPIVPKSGILDYREAPPFAEGYLETYYRVPPTADETAVLGFLLADFREHPPAGRHAELGCGPTIHHALPFAPHVASVSMLDYLDDNLDQVRRWVGDSPRAHDWTNYAKFTLEAEGADASPASVEDRMRLTRGKIREVATCNLLEDSPRDRHASFDSIGCFYCTEEIGVTLGEWRKVVERATQYLRPGGRFYLSALAGMDGYDVISGEGQTLRYPCANIRPNDLVECLTDLGFPQTSIRLEEAEIEHPDCGLTGVLVAAATKA